MDPPWEIVTTSMSSYWPPNPGITEKPSRVEEGNTPELATSLSAFPSVASRSIKTVPPRPDRDPEIVKTSSGDASIRLKIPDRSSVTDPFTVSVLSAPDPRKLIAAESALASEVPTKTLSQFLSWSDSRLAVPLAKRSMSLPAPPSSVSVRSNPPLKVRMSAPALRLTLPTIAAPAATLTAALPEPSSIAHLPGAPIDAPLSIEIVTVPLLPVSVLIAAAPAPLPPVTLPVAAMKTSPSSFSAWIPKSAPATVPMVVIETVPPPPMLCAWIAEWTIPVTLSVAATVTSPSEFRASIPVLPMTEFMAVTETVPPPPALRALIP